MAEKCMHGIDVRFCGRCSPASPVRRATVRTSAARAQPRVCQLSYVLGPGGRTVELTGSYAEGWRKLRKVWGYCEDVILEPFADCQVRVQVKLYPTFGHIREAVPTLETSSGPRDTVRPAWHMTIPSISQPRSYEEMAQEDRQQGYDLCESGSSKHFRRRSRIQYQIGPPMFRVTVHLLTEEQRLNPALPWKVSASGKPTATVTAYLRSREMDELQLQILLVAALPALRPGPVEWQRLQKHFVPGGLPELGKRR